MSDNIYVDQEKDMNKYKVIAVDVYEEKVGETTGIIECDGLVRVESLYINTDDLYVNICSGELLGRSQTTIIENEEGYIDHIKYHII